jgi:hypothetical protein
VSDFLEKRSLRKQHIVDVRRELFASLLNEWSRPPQKIDEVMGQSEYFIEPDQGARSVTINDPERGLLVQSFSPPEVWGKKVQFSYSVLVAGSWVRFGVLIQGDAKLISSFASSNECTASLERVWDRPATFMTREGGLLMEWRFDDENLYDDYVVADRYIQVSRHLHFQFGLAIHEAFFDTAFGGKED